MSNKAIIKTQILIAGGGISGYKAACTAVKKGLDVLLITKSTVAASNYVLGFNAVLAPDDSVELFAEDTMKGGAYINSKGLVDALALKSSQQVKESEELGLEFDTVKSGYDLLKPLGCTVPRLVHIENLTGKISLKRLKQEAQALGVRVMENAMLADVYTNDGSVSGACVYDLDKKRILFVQTKAAVIATGGIHITDDSTYPSCMTGDGYGIAYRAGASLTDMEFIQFEPCRCIYPQKLGISTTLLAKGGKITNSHEERFLLKHYSSEGDIPKDTLAKLIFAEIQKGNGSQHGGVYLDLTDVPDDEIIQRHSLYYNRFKNVGIDITKEKLEVAPCAHSYMGGIVIDNKCCTNVKGLFAAGESAGGIHGANRVGGNAGTEILVFGSIAGESAADYALGARESEFNQPIFDKKYVTADKEYFVSIKNQIRNVMYRYMGPVRDADGIGKAMEFLQKLLSKLNNIDAESFEALVEKKESENMLTVCICSCSAAFERKESRGVHCRSDYPEINDEYRKNFIYCKH